MYREAIEVFYSNVSFAFSQNDLRRTLSFLRNKIPRHSLARIRQITFIMTEAQCEGWFPGAAVANGYPEPALEAIFKGLVGRPSRRLNFRADWRAVLNFLSAHADLPKLSITGIW